MPEPDLIELFVRPLHAHGLRYLVAGSVGSMLYSEPRMTMDIDLAVAFEASQLSLLKAIFPMPDYYCPPDEVLMAENARECRGHFNIIHVPTGLKADLYPSHRDSFFEYAWKERREITLGSGLVHYAPPEYVIVWKVAYYAEGGSDKHARDVSRMLEISEDEINRNVLMVELERRHLREAFQRMVGWSFSIGSWWTGRRRSGLAAGSVALEEEGAGEA